MLRSRRRFILLFALCLSFCTVAVTVDYVSTAQTRTPGADEDAVEAPDSVAPVPVESADLASKQSPSAAAGAATSSNEPVAGKNLVPGAPIKSVTIVGRALDAKDHGRADTTIILFEADGTSRSTTSDKSGNFRFENIVDGQRVVLSAGNEPDAELDLPLQLAGETKVFWRTPDTKTKSGKH